MLIDIIMSMVYASLMRTTLTIEEDIAIKLKHKMQVTGLSFKSIINQTLRLGLREGEKKTSSAAQKLPEGKSLKIKKDLSYKNVEELLEYAESRREL